MSVKRHALLLLAAALLLSPRLLAQGPPPTTVAAGVLHTTENTRSVNGVRVEARPDGSVWFLLPANDQIVRLSGSVMTQWQIRTERNLGANPVDFEIDGDFVWLIETGQSQIDSNQSVFARLDTKTGQLREWIVPGTRPAGFHRTADGKVWLPQTDGRLQAVDLGSLQVTDHRSTRTIAYSDVVPGPDGALWLTDFGNNRIVRYEPGASTETFWTMLEPQFGLLNPSQIGFDEQGKLWITQIQGSRVDRFDPATGMITTFVGFTRPIHFDIFAGRLYVTEADGANGRVTVLDPAVALGLSRILTPETLDVGSVANRTRATVRDTTITPTVFNTEVSNITQADLKLTSAVPGVLSTEFPSRNAFGIDVAGGVVWVGSEGKLARLVLQTIGAPEDLAVPVASQIAGPPESQIRVEITLHNRGTAPISGQALYLFSPGSFARSADFTLAPGETKILVDPFKDAASPAAFLIGPVRLQVQSGAASDLVASVRTARTRPDGSNFGYAIPGRPAAEGLGPGATRTLFTGGRASEVSVFGFYSPSGAEATAALFSADGAERGTYAIHVAANVAQEFNPAASAFGVSPIPGDVIRVTLTSGTLLPYVNVFDPGAGDVAVSLPAEARVESVITNAGTLPFADRSYLSDLFLSNPGEGSASVTVSYYPLGSGAPKTSTVDLPPRGSRVIENVLPTLFSVEAGQGALLIQSDNPVAAALRVASRKLEGDYASFATALSAAEAVPENGSLLAAGLPQTPFRRSHLLLFNRGAAGTATIVGFDAAGAEVGRLSVTLGANAVARVNFVFAALGLPEQAAGSIRLQTSPGMRLFAATGEIDAVTGDSEFARLR